MDFERFDLEPDRPIFHGLVGDVKATDLKGLTTYEKVPIVLKIMDQNEVSDRMAASMVDIETTLKSWPQLASEVSLGAGININIARRIALKQLNISGRFYVDIENYPNRTAFNEAKLKQRDVDALYPDKPDTWWQWDSESSRIKYKKMRIKSDDVYRGAVFIIGGVFVNHLVSAFDALRVARNAERRKENGIILGMTGLPEGGFRVVLIKHF